MNAGGVFKTCKSNGVTWVVIQVLLSGARVRNTWVTCPAERDSPGKLGLIPHGLARVKMAVRLSLQDWLAAYQLVGEVTAHQGYDGYLVWEDDQAHWNWDTVQTPTGGSSRESFTMGATLMVQRRVEEEGLRIVNSCHLGARHGGE